MIKLETHCHSLGGSGCAKTPTEEIVKHYKQNGYGGIVLTNHYCKVCYDEYAGNTHKEKLDFYFSLVDHMRNIATQNGIKVFFGAEVRAVTFDGTYQEYMLYGFDYKLLYDTPPLFYLTQEQLFAFAEENGLLMYQTHPFRQGVGLGETRFMHGAESFNGHVNHVNNNERANALCEEFSLIKMSGTDFHDPFQPLTGGIYIPKTVETNAQLVECIKNKNYTLITQQEKYLKYLKAGK